MPKRKLRARRRRAGRRWLAATLAALAVAIVGSIVYGGYLAYVVTSEFDARGWDRPAQVYAAPLELYGGRELSRAAVEVELGRLGYRRSNTPLAPGRYRRDDDSLEIYARAFELPGAAIPARTIAIHFTGGRIDSIVDADGMVVPIMQLDPLLIGSIFPAHGEDRLVVAPDDVPPLLTAALIAVEDRRFRTHLGVDIRAVARAALVNISHGEIREGGSTLTQQLVRSYFLSNDRTWRRKLREAFMAVALELRHDKDALLLAYVNEVYLGQDGARAIHGFGLGSRFYFGKPLGELDVEEIALLIAVVRGPSFYDPRRHPERALERRNLVLDQMLALGAIDADAHAAARAADVGIVDPASRRSAYYTAFLDLVRRQLQTDYEDGDLQATGLKVYTTLDPAAQAAAEAALVTELDRLQPDRPPLEGALIVTNPHDAEVKALVGSRLPGFDGFNRALDAKRQVGSLIKPAVYLAALESGTHTLVTSVEDEPIDVSLDNGRTWSPRNFNDETHGTVTALRALAESLNLATVHLGLDVGLESVADTLTRLGLDSRPALYPSLLLGAIELTPFEVTQVYNSLANGGFRMPLRAVRAVVDRDGRTLNRYGLSIEQAADPGAVYALNQALVQVMERGTGKTARARLDAGLTTAGKTGTSDGFRDSWFAGFSNDRLIVAWVGNDDNLGTGLTGASGASRVWSAVMNELETRAYEVPSPNGYELAWIDYGTGLVTDARCPQAVHVPLTKSDLPPKAVDCGSDRVRVGSRIRRWFRNRLN